MGTITIKNLSIQSDWSAVMRVALWMKKKIIQWENRMIGKVRGCMKHEKVSTGRIEGDR